MFEIRVECRPGANFKTVANQKPKPQPREKKPTLHESLDGDLFKRRLAFVEATKFRIITEWLAIRQCRSSERNPARPPGYLSLHPAGQLDGPGPVRGHGAEQRADLHRGITG